MSPTDEMEDGKLDMLSEESDSSSERKINLDKQWNQDSSSDLEIEEYNLEA